MAIIIDNLSIGYGKRTVASGLNAKFMDGELTCLLGPNGIGKSTMLRTLMGLQPPISGNISYNGRSISDISKADMARIVSIVLTDKPEIGNISVREVVALGRNPYTGFWGSLSADDERIVADTIKTVGMTRYMDTPIGSLSDGERQKVMTAKALAQQTPVVLLDEPTSFLDFRSKVDMMSLLRQLAHSMHKTIVLSTHDLSLAQQMADKLWWMESTLRAISKEELAHYISDVVDSTIERP